MATPTSPGSATILTTSDLSGITHIDTLGAGSKWGGGIGSGVSLTYSFGDFANGPLGNSFYSTSSTTGYGPTNGGGEPWNGFAPFSTTQAPGYAGGKV